MAKEQDKPKVKNTAPAEDNGYDTSCYPREVISVKGDLQDITYFIQNLMEKNQIPLTEEECRGIAEFCVETCSQTGEEEDYQKSYRLPGTNRLLTFDKWTLFSIVLTAASATLTVTAPELTAVGLIGTGSSVLSSYQKIKSSLSTINRDLFCVLISARNRERGKAITPVNLKEQLNYCPYEHQYRKIYGVRCEHCSYDAESPTMHKCDLTEKDIKDLLAEAAKKEQFEIEPVDKKGDIYMFKK